LNGVIAAFEREQRAFAAFAPAEVSAAIELSTTDYDCVVFETEHRPWDPMALRDSFQFLLHRRQIFEAQTLAPAVTPLVRIPPNGSERSQWHAKQALDLGAFGIVWPHISTVDEAYNAVAACRYPGARPTARCEPAGVRGDGPSAACRYWGVSNTEYYKRSGVWPLDPDGEILVALMIEDKRGVENLEDILDQVQGVGLVLIGEGDLGQQLDAPRQYEHPALLDIEARVLATCHDRGVAVGHPHVTVENVERVIEEGYRFLMPAPVRSYPGLVEARRLTGRS
jgi:4-hydroxy-2-oxoheptanedioate aldolase